MKKTAEHLITALTVILTLSMVTLAVIYIGRLQFAIPVALTRFGSLPDGTVKAGEEFPKKERLCDMGLLMPDYAAICFDGKGGIAYGSEATELADAALGFIHFCLSGNVSMSSADTEQVYEAIKDNYICIGLKSALPYQAIYALTGDIEAPASLKAFSADVILLSFTDGGNVDLYLANDGEYRLISGAKAAEGIPSALAFDDKLLPCIFMENLVPLSAYPHHAYSVILSESSIDDAEYKELIQMLGYDGEKNSGERSSYMTVEPHGTLWTEKRRILYTASRDGGIGISDFLPESKSALDIDMYDILFASVSLTERVREISNGAFGGEGSIFLKGFYRDGDEYTVVVGISADGIEILGSELPYVACIKARGGMFTSIELRPIGVTKSAYKSSLFNSAFEYSYGISGDDADNVYGIRLLYSADEFSENEFGASWYIERKGAKEVGQ